MYDLPTYKMVVFHSKLLDGRRVPVPMGKAARVIISGRFKRCTTSSRVAGVALCDMFQHVSYRVKNRFL